MSLIIGKEPLKEEGVAVDLVVGKRVLFTKDIIT